MDGKQNINVAIGAWVVCIGVGIFSLGLIGQLNVFMWLLSFIEAVEFLIFAPQNPAAIPAIFAPTSEALLIWMGLTYFLAATITVWVLLRTDSPSSKKRTLTALSIFGVTPLVPVVALYMYQTRVVAPAAR